jgi:hypothetical protein
VITFKQKKYPYSYSDFLYWSISEKDIEFLNDLSQESYDWILVVSTKEKNIRANGYYSKSISKFLPNFYFSNTACIYKVDMIVPLSYIDVFNTFLQLNNNSVCFFN